MLRMHMIICTSAIGSCLAPTRYAFFYLWRRKFQGPLALSLGGKKLLGFVTTHTVRTTIIIESPRRRRLN